MKRIALLMVALARMATGECLAIGLLNQQTVPPVALATARATTEKIFSKLGVGIEWKTRESGCRTIQMLFDQPAVGAHGEALAYALPFEKTGPRVFIFYTRVAALSSSAEGGANLGYVIAHEIGHILEGQARHSERGVMKASWDRQDFSQMAQQQLAFAQEDTEWIHLALAASQSDRNAVRAAK